MHTNTRVPVRPSSLIEAVETRRSIRRYRSGPISPGDLREVLRLAGLSPSAWNTQPWRFVVVQDPDVRAALCDAAFGQEQVRDAPAVIAVYSDMQDVLTTASETAHPAFGDEGRAKQARVMAHFAAMTPENRAAWGHAQAHLALGFLMLAARGLGLDTNAIVSFDPAAVKRLLDLPDHGRVAALVPIGRRAEEGQPHHRLDVDRLTRWV